MIKPKSVIQRRDFEPYSEKNFKAPANFIVCGPEKVLQELKPFELDGKKFIVIDTETHAVELASTDLTTIVRRWVGSGKSAKPQDFPFCISICDGTNSYTVFDSYENGFTEFKKLAPILEDANICKIAQNFKFDLHMLHNAGLSIAGELHDTVVLSKLVNENRPSYKLVDLARGCGGIVQFEDMVDFYKKCNKIVDYRNIPAPLLGAYANADVWNCYRVFVTEYEQLQDCKTLYYSELKLMLALYDMERVGMRVDPLYRPIVQAELQARADAAESKVYELAGQVFNANSGQQLYAVLMRLGVDPSLIGKTDKGNPKLDAAAMEVLAKHGVELVNYILEFKQAMRLLNTYVVGIYSQRDAMDRVHGSINQTEATTGRMSITKPALQTLHKRDTTIRKAFIPADGFILGFSDLDQVEYRLFAHYAKAEELIDLIKAGYDVHTATASIIYNAPMYDVTKDQRQAAKTLNFSLLYGAGIAKLADSLGISQSEAQVFKRRYFAQLPTAEPFIYDVQNVNKSRGYIRNHYGRKRHLTFEESYKAPNALIQGCAADYIKHKIILIHEFLQGKLSRMINVVHDEIVYEIHESEMHIIPNLVALLSDFNTFRVPLTAGFEVGKPSWGQKEKP